MFIQYIYDMEPGIFGQFLALLRRINMISIAAKYAKIRKEVPTIGQLSTLFGFIFHL